MEFQHNFVPSLYPLSLSQRNIWDVERACPATSINNICTTLQIRGRVNFSALERSVDLVLSADSSLRTRLLLVDGVPMQYHAAFRPQSIPVYDFTQTGEDGIQLWEDAFTREVMPLVDSPLYRFAILHTGETSGSLVVKMHHMISDGWTQVLLCNRIGQAYLALLSGEEPELGNIPGYEVHIADEQKYLSSPAYQRDKAYWEQALAVHGEPSALKNVHGAAVSYVGNRLTFPLPEDLNNDIYTYCMRRRVAPFSVFYLALAIYFKRIGGADRFTIGVPIFNRRNFTEKQTSGMFVSTLPFSSEISGDWTLNEFGNRLNEAWLDMLRYQRFPFEHIRALAQKTWENSDRLFHIAFSYQNGELQESRDASVSFSGRWHYSGYQLEQLCIHLSNLEDNRRYSVDYDYLTQLFSAREIEILHSCLVNILREALTYPERPIGKLSILTPAERERVLYTFNRTAQPIYDDGLYSRFSATVCRTPTRAALICRGRRTTYEQLEEYSARVHAALAELCSGGETLIAVLLPRTEALFASMMGILRAGGAFLLLAPSLPENRIREILRQSGAAALISGRDNSRYSDLLPVIDADHLPPAADASPAPYCPDGLGYVVYTSGSTGTPKGVEICQRSLLNLSCAMEDVYGKGAVMSVCSVGFDAFLLESVCALLCGRTILLPEDRDLESPRALADLIRGYGVGFLSLTPSRLAAFIKDPVFRAAIADLESIVCGGEAFPSDLLQRLRMDTSARIYNQYGPSETTVAVSIKQLNNASAITAGSPMQNCKLYILDNWGNPLPIGIYGNLYVGGICVGRGYRGESELTAAVFTDNPFEMGDRLYRTGDIARWTADGEIVLGGRSDRQVKLRGFRIEPQEVADCLKRHSDVLEAAAAVQRCGEQDVLVAFYTASAPVTEQELMGLCASHLPYYMIPSAILPVDEIPLTMSGKVNEALLPRPVLTSGGDAEASTDMEKVVLSIFRRVLGRSDISVGGDYFLFGGNSLNAMEALSEIGQETGRLLRVSDLYANRTAQRLALLLDGEAAAVPAVRLAPAPAQERWPLTPIQQGIYFQSHLDPTGRTYHMAGGFRLASKPDHKRLENAFRALIAADPILRTAFISEPDGIFAKIRSEADFVLPIYEGSTVEEAAEAILAPFDLSKAPLLRAGLWEETEGQWVLLINIHHIIGDGLTTPILLKRLDAIYRGAQPDGNGLSYLDYAWHLTSRGKDEKQLGYWKDHLSDLPEQLDIPADFARSRDFDFLGGTVKHAISPALTEKCDAFCAEHGISPYMFFLSAFGILLSRLSGKDDILVGAAAAGRLMSETRDMCGPFINTLPLRLKPQERRGSMDYLLAVRDEVNAMLDHQEVGLEEITSALGIRRTLTQSPLYQVIFSQRPVDAEGFRFDGAPMDYLPLSTGTARMDLWVELAKENGVYTFHTEYSSALFLPETAAYYSRCLETVAASLIASGDRKIADIEALSLRDRIQLIDTPNNTVYPFLNLPVPTQFAQQLLLDPDAPAVIFHGEITTRAQLDRRACQIANLLADAGAKHGAHVGIALSRNADLVAAVLAIWKVGGAYVPLLAHYPEQRLRSMAETADITHILCDEKTRQQLPECFESMMVPLSNNAKDTFDAAPLKETDLAEILFTSGSTGNPKGVMLQWRSVANLTADYRRTLERSEGAILCTTNVVFDMFNGEVTIPLAIGKTIVMADEEEMMLPWKLGEIIRRDSVRITQSTPSRVQMWLSNENFCRSCADLDVMIYAGEVLTETLLRMAQTAAPNSVQVNLYGPTEGTVYNTERTADYRSHINVGWPMRNNRVYVLDDMLRPVLPTAVGDLYLAGESLSAGYINRPDLTEAAYLPDPFCPGQLMYRTGDIGRLRLDGSYDFLGRRDAQVKLNGQRVELDEINGAFVTEGCALQAATVPLRHEDGSMELVTYYVPAPDALSESEIRSRIGKILPAYMIPSSIVSMSVLPSTPTGKIDLRALKSMAASEPPAAAPAPTAAETAVRTPAETDAGVGSLDWVLTLWRRVLGRSDIAPAVSFFEQGGTSLAALSILSFYNNSGLTMTLAQFYENPTAERQAMLLNGAAAASGSVPAVRTEKAQESPCRRSVPALPTGRGRRSLKAVLLTGATGFLGVHILKTLLEEGAGKILCTMRDGDRERLMDTLGWYFGAGWVSGVEHQIEVVPADISRPGMGLSPKDYQALSGRITAIWNCAADVRHYAADADALLAVNLRGTEEVIKLSRASGAPLYHMSTTSVSGDRLPDGESAVFTEEDFDIGQNWRDNLYVRSKFLAEEAVFDAVRSGLNARVFRLGRLVGRSQDGIFQKNPQTNAFYLTMRGIHAIGAIPASMADFPMELTPIDWCARAAVALRCSDSTVYHLQSPTPPTAAEAARAVVEDLEILPDEVFRQRLRSAGADAGGDVLAPLVDFFHQSSGRSGTIAVDNSRTMQQLSKAGFTESIAEPHRLLRAFRFSANERIGKGE